VRSSSPNWNLNPGSHNREPGALPLSYPKGDGFSNPGEGNSLHKTCLISVCSLHVAAMRNKFDVVQLLIVNSADMTAVDYQGRTALHCAAKHGASEVIEVLSQVCIKACVCA